MVTMSKYFTCMKGNFCNDNDINLFIDRIVKQLISWNPMVTMARDSKGFTPLHCACCYEKQLKVVKAFGSQLDSAELREAQTHTEKNTPLHIACKNGGEDIVRFLLEKNANANATNQKRVTPLHISATHGFTEISKLLLERDADVEMQDADGCTPLIYAARGKHEKVISLLLSKYVKTFIIVCSFLY